MVVDTLKFRLLNAHYFERSGRMSERWRVETDARWFFSGLLRLGNAYLVVVVCINRMTVCVCVSMCICRRLTRSKTETLRNRLAGRIFDSHQLLRNAFKVYLFMETTTNEIFVLMYVVVSFLSAVKVFLSKDGRMILCFFFLVCTLHHHKEIAI